MKIYYLYKIVFLCGYPEGRYYLGKRAYAGNNVEKDSYAGSGSFPKAYFKCYGKHLNVTYTKEILEYNENAKRNGVREKEIIGNLGKTDPLCMNRKLGGLGGEEFVSGIPVIQYDLHGIEIARFQSQKEAQAATGVLNSSISQCCLGRVSESGRFIGRFENDPLTEKELKTIAFHSTPVKQYTTNCEFIKEGDSVKEAAETLGINSDSIYLVCQHKSKTRHTAGGFVGSYYNEDPLMHKTKPFVGKRRVRQLDKNSGKLISEFESLKDAAEAVHGCGQHIQNCCNGKKKSAYGYVGEFIDVVVTMTGKG